MTVNPVELLLGLSLLGLAIHALNTGKLMSASIGNPWLRNKNPAIYWTLVLLVGTAAIVVLIDTLVLDI